LTSRILPGFEYFTPKSLEEASSLLAQYGQKSSILAGGTDLLVQMKSRQKTPKYVLDIKRIPGLNRIECDETMGLRIGSLATIHDIETSEIIQKKFPIILEAARTFGSVQVRNMATLGGNLCNASPAADMAPPLLVLDAKVQAMGRRGERTVSLDGFFLGPSKTILEKDEILTEIQVPDLPPNTGTAFFKIGRVKSDLAKVNVAVALVIKEGDFCEEARIALGAVAPTPIRARRTEKALRGRRIDGETMNEAAEAVDTEIEPITDVRSTAEYRREVSKVLVKHGIQKSLERVV